MARVAITPVQMLRDSGVSWGAGTAGSASGHVIASPGPYQLVLLITNADSAAHTAVIRGAGYTGAASGAANSATVLPQNVVFTQGTVGDLSVTVANGDTEVVKIATTNRFTQPDGSVFVDFPATPTSVTVRAFTEPYVVA